MMTIISGVGLLLLTLAVFSIFSLKFPKGSQAMSGMANAAVASFLIEAVHKYITGDLLGIAFLGEVGATAGSLGGVAAGIMVPLSMGVNPVFAVVGGLACGGYGILPGFIAGYIVGLIAPYIEKYLPTGLDIILGSLTIAPMARLFALVVDPAVNSILGMIGGTITAAADQSPVIMGFLLGGIMKMICTSPLSSMALTAMLGLTGLPMGIAAIACFGGSFTNGMVFHKMGYGDKSNIIAVMLEPLTQAHIVTAHPIPIFVSNFFGGGLAGLAAAMLGIVNNAPIIAVMLEPLTQAHIVTAHPIPIFVSNFFGGGLAGLAAAMLGIVNNAPGTASPIPGLIAPFGFNPAGKVILALALAAVGGLLAGYVGGTVFSRLEKRKKATAKAAAPATYADPLADDEMLEA